jgi:hypothetical protein
MPVFKTGAINHSATSPTLLCDDLAFVKTLAFWWAFNGEHSMGKHQTGYLYKVLRGWHVRYWKTELKDGKPVPRNLPSIRGCSVQVGGGARGILRE